MSIWTSLYTGASGLEAHGDAISVVGDNIANVSTIGYKSSRANFEDVIGGIAANGQGLGNGVRMGGVDTMLGQGALENTGRSMDMAISGGGYFVAKGSHDGISGQYYTRDGAFNLDKTGTLVNGEGLDIQGYMIDATGKASTTATNLQIGGDSPPNATTELDMSVNVDPSSVTPAAPWSAANPSGTSNYSTSTTVYDSLGTAHRADVYFRANGAGGWDWHAMVDGGELTGGTKGVPQEIANGTMTFNTDGSLQAQSTVTSSANFIGATAGQAIKFSFGDDKATGGTGLAGSTQFAGASSVKGIKQDGYGAGSLVDITTAADGTITGKFSNGQSRPMARLALATFADPQDLQRVGTQDYTETTKSGAALVGAATTGGSGSISSGALEQSNVDLSSELVTLIAYQRAFQANSKIVTTADEMLTQVDQLIQ